MLKRTLGRTGLTVSALGFGCGAVGGLMVKGAPADQERAVARAMELGINYFDTAWLYGRGESERNLGRVLRNLGRPEVVVATKVMLDPGSATDLGAAVAASLEGSLQRLGLDRVDLFFLHNNLVTARQGADLDPGTVRDQLLGSFERLKREGKTRFIGFTALGETPAMHALLPHFDAAQICFNLLNPSADHAVAAGFPGQDYGALLARAHGAGVGTVGIRVLAGGALSGSEARHPIGMASVDPLGSGSSYARDVARAHRLLPLVAQGYVADTVEAALRYAISSPHLDTTLVGLSTLQELEKAAASVARGPLEPEAMELVASIQSGFAGEAR